MGRRIERAITLAAEPQSRGLWPEAVEDILPWVLVRAPAILWMGAFFYVSFWHAHPLGHYSQLLVLAMLPLYISALVGIDCLVGQVGRRWTAHQPIREFVEVLDLDRAASAEVVECVRHALGAIYCVEADQIRAPDNAWSLMRFGFLRGPLLREFVHEALHQLSITRDAAEIEQAILRDAGGRPQNVRELISAVCAACGVGPTMP